MIDLICAWPIGFDYPLYRKFIRENRQRFHRVVIVWTNNHNGLDLHQKIEEAMKTDDIAFIVTPTHTGDQDWRDVAMKKALEYSRSPWIWFTEQDFTPQEGFWEIVDEFMPKVDLITINDNGRMHPASLFIKRKVLDQTDKDFSPVIDISDHFSRLQDQLMNWDPPLVAYTIAPQYYHHMNGLTHNLYLKQVGKHVTYKPEEFEEYLKKCEEADIEHLD